MSKVICEICGTAYPDTATECPICGFPRNKITVDLEDLQLPEMDQPIPVSADRVKGGRFSNKNVKKRQEEDNEESYYDDYDSDEDTDEPQRKPGKGMKVLVGVLALCVIAVGCYIGYRFYEGRDAYDAVQTFPVSTNPAAAGESSAATETQTETSKPTEAGTPCTDLLVSNTEIKIQGVGRGWLLGVSAVPEDTTDSVVFTSSDEAVAKVSESGRITSVGPGTATITITCGSVTKECIVHCDFEGAAPTAATEENGETKPTEAKPADPDSIKGFHLDRSDVTLFKKGESFSFGVYNDGIDVSVSKVEWKSDDEAIAKVENGKVTAVAAGTTTITATYEGQTQKCTIRCRFDKDSVDSGDSNVSYKDNNWKISNEDVTLVLHETFELTLKNNAGETAKVNWSSSNQGVVAMDGNSITGKIVGMTNVSATIDGKTYTCIVRVIEHR